MKKFEKTDDTVTSQTEDLSAVPATEPKDNNRLSSQPPDEQPGNKDFPKFDDKFINGIRCIARSIVDSDHRRQAGWDFIEEAPGLIASRRAKYDPKKSGAGGFGGWASTVLRNAWRDQLRRESRRAKSMSMTLTGHRSDDADLTLEIVDYGRAAVHKQEVHLRWLEAFSEADRNEILSWTATQVIMLLGLSGLWHKLAKHDATESLWSTCLQKCGIAHFPEEPLDAEEDLTHRLQIIADAMGVQQDSARRQWKRSKHLLQGLDFIQIWAPGLRER